MDSKGQGDNRKPLGTLETDESTFQAGHKQGTCLKPVWGLLSGWLWVSTSWTDADVDSSSSRGLLSRPDARPLSPFRTETFLHASGSKRRWAEMLGLRGL